MEFLTLLLPFAKLLFDDCGNKSNAGRAEDLKRYPILVRAKSRRAYREGGLRGRSLRSKVNETMSAFNAASVRDVEEFLDELENGNDE